MLRGKSSIAGRTIKLAFKRQSGALSALFLLVSSCLQAQEFQQQMRFVNHLFQLKQYEEASTFLHGIANTVSSLDRIDSIHYYAGEANYHLKNIPLSVEFFGKVSEGSPFFAQSKLLMGFQLAYSGKYAEAESTFINFSSADSLLMDTRLVELAGLHLLNRNYESYEPTAENFDGKYFQLKSSENALKSYYQSMQAFRPKSTLLAGVFSAIVPGSGKIYAGKTGQGIGSMLLTGLFALQTWESYKKDGYQSARFMIFGSLLGVSYVSNIYGSVFSVKIRRDEFNEEINNAILVDMHVPLRLLLR